MNTAHLLTGLASHLVRDGLLQPLQAVEALQKSKEENISFVSSLVKNNYLNSTTIATSCAKNFDLRIFDLKNYSQAWFENSNINLELIQRYQVIPLQKENNILHLGMTDPTDRQALDAIAFHTGATLTPVIILEDQLKNFINEKSNRLSLPKELSFDDNQNYIQENIVNYDEPLIHFVDNIIQHAIKQSASDIHIEPYNEACRIRYRIDGILYETTEIPIQLATRLTTRLKVMAKLDITERRLPQDGRFQRHNIDIRINSCPVMDGEKIVLRLLNTKKTYFNINDLGFNALQQQLFLKKISQPQGLILVTGPTGSGKTVTLYSAINHLNTTEKNILTVEDPIEIQLKGINQVNINEKIGLDFATTLKTFLRQDPDIIMVGEIRDPETAKIAVQSAQTGHLVLSTLHTNNALDTISRLQMMGIDPYNIIHSLSLIIAQRLVRVLCVHCKQIQEDHTYRAIGCDQCLQGFHGRMGIYEFLPITESLAQQILAGNPKLDDHSTLRTSGLEKVTEGITTLDEINRVINT